MVGPLINFWQPQLLPVAVANIKPHILPHLIVVNNAQRITWTPYAQFQPDKSINELMEGIMMSYGCSN